MSVVPQLIELNEEGGEGPERLQELEMVEDFQGMFSRHHWEVTHEVTLTVPTCTGPSDIKP